jgi:hypothetical protein
MVQVVVPPGRAVGVGVAVAGTLVGVRVAVAGTLVGVPVAVGGTPVDVGVAVAGTAVDVGVAVAGTAVEVGVAVEVGGAPVCCGPRSLFPFEKAAAAFKSVEILSLVCSGLKLQFQPPA